MEILKNLRWFRPRRAVGFDRAESQVSCRQGWKYDWLFFCRLLTRRVFAFSATRRSAETSSSSWPIRARVRGTLTFCCVGATSTTPTTRWRIRSIRSNSRFVANCSNRPFWPWSNDSISRRRRFKRNIFVVNPSRESGSSVAMFMKVSEKFKIISDAPTGSWWGRPAL